LKKILVSTPGPKTASFRVMPGKLDPRHWYANYAESGGRVLGEACHFLDYFCFLFDAQPARVLAQTTWPAGGRLPFSRQRDGANRVRRRLVRPIGLQRRRDSGFPKEALTVYAAGLVAEITNFQELVVHRGRKRKSISFSSKGHAEEMAPGRSFCAGRRGIRCRTKNHVPACDSRSRCWNRSERPPRWRWGQRVPEEGREELCAVKPREEHASRMPRMTN